MQRFTDKVILVTGAASGIGRAASLRLAAEDGSVLCADINAQALDAVVADITAAGGKASACVLDISKEDSVNACVQNCIDRYGKLDAVVNMAGLLRFDTSHELPLDGWQRIIDINLTGTFLLCKATLPHLLQTRGNIVNAASTAALAGLPCGVAYSASKGGVLAMTRSIAVEYAKRGVRANCICPGDIKTGMTSGIQFPKDYDWDLIGRISSLSGAKEPSVVAGLIAMLASDDGIHITGEDIRVDGGTLA